ncbi:MULTISPECIES: LysR family transcriptional regulator [unclassified Caballeronia]|uniref:LysR substrate-binding domain-containing protein n=1 Tax=unclassified Caballeronia TaxID=2646786 RepID=UPI002856DDF3|nr:MULTISPECIES: LysR family transcriptional regulator [unclassified Caballeronia]MDR5814314.1 LysR family transcriptional regulator [Caballeronia sp. LZ033]MDR5820791.1 LysR family transcriptional regulator [Caballeronia sp. LZ043]MDR5878892.1 LysR family transcriptional regulator [Caballeronia sp. LZ032]
MDRFLAMKVFARVVEAGSFSKAADALRLPPASVSRTLQALEAHLGARLINRTTRSISITEDGEAYYERCVRVLGEVDDMEASLTHSKTNPKGHIKISLPQVMAKSTIIPALPEFFAAYPDIGVELLLTDRQVDLVEEAVDCVVRVGAVGDVGLVAKRIGAYTQITCAAPKYIEAHGEPQTLDDLEQHLAIGYVLNHSGRVRNWEFGVNGETRSFTMKHQIAVNDGDSYIAAGVAGLGLIQASSYTLDPLLKSGALKEILQEYPSYPRVVSVLYAANRHQPRRVRVFIDWVAELYSRLPTFQVRSAGKPD